MVTDSSSTALINEFAEVYTKYFTHISTNKDPAYIKQMTDSKLDSLIEEFQWYVERTPPEKRDTIWFKPYLISKMEEYKRLNEYHDIVGPLITEHKNPRPGSRYLP